MSHNFLYFLFCCFSINTILGAQNNNGSTLSSGLNNHKYELLVGGGVHTTGFQVKAAFGLVYNPKRTGNIVLEFGEIKDPSERQQTYDGLSIVGGAPKSFIYGKRNNLYQSRFVYAEKLYLSDKNNRAISLGLSYAAGFSLGMLRPYYLDLIYRNNVGIPTVTAEKFSQENQFKFLTPQEVDGPSGITYGWDELSLYPGFCFKAGLLVDGGASDSILKDIEVGVAADIYFSDIPLMVFEAQTPVFFNIFLNVHLGHRW